VLIGASKVTKKIHVLLEDLEPKNNIFRT